MTAPHLSDIYTALLSAVEAADAAAAKAAHALRIAPIDAHEPLIIECQSAAASLQHAKRAAITYAIAMMETAVADDVDAIDTEDALDEDLDERFNISSLGGPFAAMFSSTVLRKCEPCAYRQFLNDFIDDKCRSEEWAEINDEYFPYRAAALAMEAYLDDLPDSTPEYILSALQSAADNI